MFSFIKLVKTCFLICACFIGCPGFFPDTFSLITWVISGLCDYVQWLSDTNITFFLYQIFRNYCSRHMCCCSSDHVFLTPDHFAACSCHVSPNSNLMGVIGCVIPVKLAPTRHNTKTDWAFDSTDLRHTGIALGVNRLQLRYKVNEVQFILERSSFPEEPMDISWYRPYFLWFDDCSEIIKPQLWAMTNGFQMSSLSMGDWFLTLGLDIFSAAVFFWK